MRPYIRNNKSGRRLEARLRARHVPRSKDDWLQETHGPAAAKHPDCKESFSAFTGREKDAIYSPDDSAEFHADAALGYPGEASFEHLGQAVGAALNVPHGLAGEARSNRLRRTRCQVLASPSFQDAAVKRRVVKHDAFCEPQDGHGESCQPGLSEARRHAASCSHHEEE